jgi:hypothetical protein
MPNPANPEPRIPKDVPLEVDGDTVKYCGIGAAKIAFIWAFHYLHKQTPYSEAIRDMLLQGGDTDTNAAIVGGLIGAWQGFTSIPKDWVSSVLNFRCTEYTDNQRDDWLIPGFHLVPLTKAVFINAPSSLLVRIGGLTTPPNKIYETVDKELQQIEKTF